MNKKIKVAMAQILCLDGDLAGNLVRIRNAVEKAKQGGADAVLFPESCLLGWIYPEAHQRASPIPGPDSDKLCALAKEFDLFVAIGLDEKDGDKLYDSAILISNEGEILLKHRKINTLTELLSPPYAVGHTVEVAETALGRIGMVICADTFDEPVLQKIENLRADLMLVPYGWAALETSWPEHGKELAKVVANTAKRAICPVLGTNLIGEISRGPWAGKTYGGQSVAYDAKGNQLALGKDRDTDLLFVNWNIDS